jgi:AraC family transcriptional regulator
MIEGGGAASKRSREVLGDQSERRRRLVERVKEFVRSRVDQSISVAAVASEVGVSPYHLCRIFRAETRETIWQYAIDTRITKAKVELCTADKRITEIALELGFSSHSHFTATFTSRVGISPAKFRRRNGAVALDQTSAEFLLTNG